MWSRSVGTKNLPHRLAPRMLSQFNPTAGTATVLRPELALATLVAIAPVLIVFLFAQRYLVTGLLAGSTKE